MGCHGNTGETRGKEKTSVYLLGNVRDASNDNRYLIPSLLVLVQCKMEVCVSVLFHFKVKIQSGLLLEKYVIFEEEVRWV